MTISRGQMPRQMYGLGSLVKKAVKGVTGAVKKIAGSDLGKAALLAAGAYGLGGGKIPFFGKSLPFLTQGGGFSPSNILPNLGGIMGLKSGKDALLGNVLKVGGYGTLLGGALAGMGGEQEDSIGGERNVEALRTRLTKAYKELRYPEEQIPALVEADLAEYTSGAGGYAEGGRIGYSDGTQYTFEQFLKDKQQVDQATSMEQLRREYEREMELKKIRDQRNLAAYGGRMGYAFGTPEENAIQASGIMGLPLNQNPAGVTELDLRETGGFIPPVGVKEKADDIPAMLSNNEFVMTADAVREFGDGDVNKGAERMYAMMKKLENGGRV
jgi:hypothetical protein